MLGLISFPDFYKQNIHSAVEHAILNCLRNTRDRHRIKYITYAECNRFKVNNPFQFILTYKSDWLIRYFTKSYHHIDPIFYQGFEQASAIDWAEIKDENEQIKAFFEDGFSYGIGSQGITIPTTTDANFLSNVSFTFDASIEEWSIMKAKSMPEWRTSANIIQSQINFLLHNNPPQSVYTLTERELKCLHWAALGKTDSEISKILDIGLYTIHGYMRNIRFKLDCVNKTSAVAKAMTLGILKLKNVATSINPFS